MTSFDEIKEALDFDTMTKAEQDDLLLELNELIFKGTMIRVLEVMDEKDKEGFHDLIDQNASSEELSRYIQSHVSNIDFFVAETVQDLTQDIQAVLK